MQDGPPARPIRPSAAFLQAQRATIHHDAGRVEVIRRLEPNHDRLLADHRIDGVPVLPFAGAMELMAQTASVAQPELEVVELREITLNQGVQIEDQPTSVRVVAMPSSATVKAGSRALDVTIHAGEANRPRYQSTVVLAEQIDATPPEDAEFAALPALNPTSLTVDEAYAEHLFHGPLFRGIERIEGIGEHGAVALLRPSDPAACLSGVTPGTAWLLDPVLIDCALQMQLIWCRTHWGLTLLPARMTGYRRLAPPPGAAEPSIRHELRQRPSSQPPICTADHLMYGEKGLVATLTGVTGVGSKALNRLAKAPA